MRHVEREFATVFRARGGDQRFFTEWAAYRNAAKVALNADASVEEFDARDIDSFAAELQGSDAESERLALATSLGLAMAKVIDAPKEGVEA